MFNPREPEHHSVNRKSFGSGATIVDLSANPYDIRPAVNSVLIQMKQAIADGFKPLVAVGESHDDVAHASFALLLTDSIAKDLELLRQPKPVIALETPHNLLEMGVRNKSLWQRLVSRSNKTLLALNDLKQASPEAYHRLNLICSDSMNWSYVPITRLQNFMAWREDEYDVRLVDVARDRNDEIDLSKQHIVNFIKDFYRGRKVTKEDEFNIRNIFMADKCHDILQSNQALILQTGLAHLGGWREEDCPYNSSLSAIDWSLKGIRLINVFQESSAFTFLDGLTVEAQTALSNPDTIISKGGIECRHMIDSHGSYEDEIKTLAQIYEQSGVLNDKPQIVSQEEADALLLRAQNFIRQDLREITEDYIAANPPLWRRVLSVLTPS